MAEAHLKDDTGTTINKKDNNESTSSEPVNVKPKTVRPYNELAEVYREPRLGSAKELEPFTDFDLYREELFEHGTHLPTGIYTHSSEIEDDNISAIDIYDQEVAR